LKIQLCLDFIGLYKKFKQANSNALILIIQDFIQFVKFAKIHSKMKSSYIVTIKVF